MLLNNLSQKNNSIIKLNKKIYSKKLIEKTIKIYSESINFPIKLSNGENHYLIAIKNTDSELIANEFINFLNAEELKTLKQKKEQNESKKNT